jgi:hypothetical protein
MCIWNCDYDNKITKKKQKKQRKISQIFQNKICFYLFHYTNKNEKKGQECCKKKKKNNNKVASFKLKENKEIS